MDHKVEFVPLKAEEEKMGKAVVSAAYKIHKSLGPGLLEKVYEVYFCHVLKTEGYYISRQIDVLIQFEGIQFDEGLRLDVLVNDLVICELKALEQLTRFGMPNYSVI